MAERDLVVPREPILDPKTGQVTLAWLDFFSLLVSKIKALETP